MPAATCRPPPSGIGGSVESSLRTADAEASGTQQILHSYELLPGEEYELKIEARAGVLTTHLRSVAHQPKFVAIARFQPQARAEDAVRGGLPHALLLQAYWNNGTSAKGIRFTHLSLAQ